jgi:tripartite-type tricarboxylate transporter receptor subunit TctC
MALPDARQRLAVLGFEPTVSTPEEFAAHMRAETDTWRAVVHDANIKIEMIGANDLVTVAFP